MSEEKKLSEQLKEKLFSQKKNAVYRMNDSEIKACDDFSEDYKKFLDTAKTEREAVKAIVEELQKKGYREYKAGSGLRTGDRIYINNRDKAVICAVIGSEPIETGIRLCAAHIDSPRLDLKQNPIYEDSETAQTVPWTMFHPLSQPSLHSPALYHVYNY